MTLYTKNIWVVTTSTGLINPPLVSKIAASSLDEVLAHFNKEGISHIIKIEKLFDKITYKH